MAKASSCEQCRRTWDSGSAGSPKLRYAVLPAKRVAGPALERVVDQQAARVATAGAVAELLLHEAARLVGLRVTVERGEAEQRAGVVVELRADRVGVHPVERLAEADLDRVDRGAALQGDGGERGL